MYLIFIAGEEVPYRKRIIGGILFLFFFTIPVYSAYYFKDDFTNLDRTRWSSDIQLGRAGYYPYVINAPFDPIATNGLLRYGNGEPMDNGPGQGSSGAWIGKTIVLTNINKFTATPQNPFGFIVIISQWAFNLEEAPTDASEIGLFAIELVEDLEDNIMNYTNMVEKNFNNFIQFFNRRNKSVGIKTYWGAYVNGTDIDFDLTSALRADMETYTNINYMDGLGINDGTIFTNTAGLMITHNGSEIKMYLNPDPYNKFPDKPNEFLFLGSYPVTFSDNLRIAINQQTKEKSSWVDAWYDYLLIRSAVDSHAATLTSGGLGTVFESTNYSESERKPLLISITPVINITNAGINVITVEKPSDWGSWSTINLTNEIIVETAYEDGSTLKSNIIRPLSQLNSLATNEAVIQTNNNTLWIRLGKAIDHSFSNPDIKVSFKLTTPVPSVNKSIHTFYAAVDSVLFDPIINNQTNYSTCGPQKNSVSIQIESVFKDPADGFASIIPNQIVQGNNEYSFTFYLQTTTNVNTWDIADVAILIPGSFIVNTNTIDPFKITNDSLWVSVQEIPALAGPGTNFIKINYAGAGAKLSAGGEMDIITFTIKGDSTTGTWQWKTWVGGDTIDASSLQAKTNGIFKSQNVTVLRAPPDVEGGLVSLEDPLVLFNTVTKNTLEYKLRNQASAAESDNKIISAVLFVPGVFTNISVITSTKIPLSAITYGSISNYTTVTLYYSAGGGPIDPGGTDYDIISLLTYHSLTNNQTTNVSFSAVVNNSNGQGFVDLKVSLITNLLITDPEPEGKAYVEVTDGNLYTSDLTNEFTYRIYNTSPSGNILFSFISIPTNYFILVTNISSSRVSTAYISNNGLNISIDYSTNVIQPGEYDTITFTLRDKYTNYSVSASAVIESKAANFTVTNETIDYDILQDFTRAVYFTPQEARVQSWVSNNTILADVTTSTLYYIFNNNGDLGNRVKYAEAMFSGSGGGGIISLISKATSETSGLWNISGLTFYKTNYNLDGSQRDVVKVIINDTIISETFRDFIPLVTVNTSSLVPTSLPAGKTNQIFFQNPPPEASGKIFPNVIFISTNKVTNSFIYSIYNDGEGSNELEEAVIYIPSILQNKVSGIYSSWLGGSTYITNKSDRIIISYISAGNTLNTKTIDDITLIITNELGTNTTLLWELGVANNDGKGIYTNTGTIQGGSKQLIVIDRPDAYINSATNIFDSSRTNHLEYKFINPTSGGEILKARIYIPPIYSIIPGTLSSTNKGGAIFSITNSYIEIDYKLNTLKEGENDIISFDIFDTVNKMNNISKWSSQIQYFTNGIFSYTSEDIRTQYLKIILATAAAAINASPDKISITSITNTITVIVSNLGEKDNYITRVRLNYPDTEWSMLSADSSIITNAVNEYWFSGYLYFKYDLEGKNIPTGTNDIIILQFTDSITTVCSKTLYCGVNNRDPGIDDYSTFGNSKIINFVLPADAYIMPNNYSDPENIETTTYTNIYTYKINNIGKNRAIEQAVIKLPSVISNIVYIKSSYMATNTNIIWDSLITSITLNYYKDGNGSLSTTTNDAITMQLVDSFEFGYTNLLFESYINDGNGYVKTITTASQSKSVGYYMPGAEASAYIEPTKIYTSLISNIFTYIISNKGYGSDRILKARIFIPSGFTLVNNIKSSIISNDALYAIRSGNYIILDYSGDGKYISPQTCDIVTFQAFDSITSENSFIWPSEVYNYATNWQAADIYPSKTQTVDTTFPDYNASAYIEPNIAYSADITNDFSYTVSNSSILSNNRVYYVKIIIPPEVVNVTNVQSLLCSTQIMVLSTNIISTNTNIQTNYIYEDHTTHTVDLSNHYILIDYSTNSIYIGQNQKDIITFTAEDNTNYGSYTLF